MALVLAGLTLATTSAQSAEIPAKYRGEWCDHGSGSYYTRFKPRECKRGGVGYLRVTASGFTSPDVKCDLMSIRERDYMHVVTFDCETREDGPMVAPMWMVLVPGIPGKEGHERARLFLENED
jgi:hypothetical protein